MYPSLDLRPLHLGREQAVLQRPEKHDNKNKLAHHNSTVLKNENRDKIRTLVLANRKPTRAHMAGLKKTK